MNNNNNNNNNKRSHPPNHHQPPHQRPPNLHQPPPNRHQPPHLPPRKLNQPPPTNHHQPPPNHHQPPYLPPRNLHQPPPQPPRQSQIPIKPPKNKRTTLASCIVATIFLIFLLIILFIVYFSIFKPKDPSISIVSFTFSFYAAVKNPNRAIFTHFDSSLQLLYAGNQVGFMFIPAGKIAAGKSEFMAATFSVQSFPVSATAAPVAGGNIPAVAGENIPVTDGIERVKPTMELEMRMEMVGRVRALWVFSHHVETTSDCYVDVTISDGSVLGFHCS
ncbi:uncharacterized protein LOC104892140 [Beta vulgaris subsp. vulgaris]|uniref:uncharacterized protein LOC104892140 n=1 Tax=Beta vulgaris subsp. vulgaris TaxID=3555 RepID=UPI002036F2BE|nr:uncharacterized protein LOC104892140 [Beta vulgaris subsp. vulgaris]